MRRFTWEVYAEIIDLCPMIYTRLIQASGANTRTMNRCFDLGLIEKKESKGEGNDTYRKIVYIVHPTEKGKMFKSFVRNIQEMLKNE